MKVELRTVLEEEELALFALERTKFVTCLSCIVTACALLSGCNNPNEQMTFADEPPPPMPMVPQPTLATAGDSSITLFGEIPNVPVYDFESRAAVSLRQHTYPSEGSDFDPSLNRAGKTLVFASTRHSHTPDIYIKDIDGVAVTQLTSDPASDVQPAFSPDGRRVAFATDRTGNWDIWVVNIDGHQAVQITTSAAHEVHPSWSPDGTQLVFSSLPERGGQWELWLASAEAGAIKKFIGYGLFPEWAPNSNRILYQRARQRGTRWFSLWTMELVNGEPRLPTEILSSPEHAMILPTWSPDENQIAFCSVENVPSMDVNGRNPFQRADIWMVDLDGRGRVRLTDGIGSNYAPTWSKLGRILFTSSRGGDETQETVWSVIPLRAPMGVQRREANNMFLRSEEARADELLGDESEQSRIETVGWPRPNN